MFTTFWLGLTLVYNKGEEGQGGYNLKLICTYVEPVMSRSIFFSFFK